MDYFLKKGFGSEELAKRWFWVAAPTGPVQNSVQRMARQIWDDGIRNHVVQWTDVKGDRYLAPPSRIHRHAFVGIGTSIAYYLNAMGDDFDHRRTLIFGKVDAWSPQVRGDGFINHEAHQVSQWSTTVPRYSETYMERTIFAEQNRQIFVNAKRQGARHISREIKSISVRGDVVEVEDSVGMTYLVARAVVGSGAGPHYSFGEGRGPVLDRKFVSPPARARAKDQLIGKVVNLDEFMRLHPRTDQMSGSLQHAPERDDIVIVHGPNAGIDAVHRAWQYGYKVIWLSGSTDPVLLAGNRLGLRQTLQTDRITFQKIGRASPEVEAEGEGVRVRYTYQNAPQSPLVAYYVIALGQDPFAPGAVGHILTTGGVRWRDMEPIYDVNQIFGLPYQTVLGFQSKGTRYGRGLQIIGAAADALARDQRATIAHNYDEQFGLEGTSDPKLAAQSAAAERYLEGISMADLMDHQVNPDKVSSHSDVIEEFLSEWQEFALPSFSTKTKPAATSVASVVLNAQLGGVRAAAAALNGFIPKYVGRGDANLTTDDRTMLAVYVAQNFPYIPGELLEEIVNFIIKERRSENMPLGYSNELSDQIKGHLEQLNERYRLEEEGE